MGFWRITYTITAGWHTSLYVIIWYSVFFKKPSVLTKPLFDAGQHTARPG
jgi:hypothetical protein